MILNKSILKLKLMKNKKKTKLLENYLNHQALNVLYDIDVQIQLVHDEHQHRNPKKMPYNLFK